jgi:hypothetical protein
MEEAGAVSMNSGRDGVDLPGKWIHRKDGFQCRCSTKVVMDGFAS